MTFEITVETLAEALLAEKHGAKRVEVCSALDLGGLTPSLGLIQSLMDNLIKTEIHVLIRTRPGNFTYSKEEVLIMLHDIQTIAQLGVHGVVIGFLNPDKTVDLEITELMTDHAKKLGLEVTFHRAIDFCPNPEITVTQLIDLKIDRILTSGQMPTAIEGIENLKKMIDVANGKIEIMSGSGVNVDCAKELIGSGVHALHFSIRKKLEESNLQMGTTFIPDEEKIEAIAAMIS